MEYAIGDGSHDIYLLSTVLFLYDVFAYSVISICGALGDLIDVLFLNMVYVVSYQITTISCSPESPLNLSITGHK